MNLLFATLASLMAPEVTRQTNAQAQKFAAVQNPSPLEEMIAERVNFHYQNTGNDIFKYIAEIITLLDPKYSNVTRIFQKKSGQRTELVFEAFTMLTSLGSGNHPIPTGVPFLVIHGKRQHCITMDGKMVQYDRSENSCRLSTKEEIEKYFSNLTNLHIKLFFEQELLAPYAAQALEKISKMTVVDPETKPAKKKRETPINVSTQPVAVPPAPQPAPAIS